MRFAYRGQHGRARDLHHLLHRLQGSWRITRCKGLHVQWHGGGTGSRTVFFRVRIHGGDQCELDCQERHGSARPLPGRLHVFDLFQKLSRVSGSRLLLRVRKEDLYVVSDEGGGGETQTAIEKRADYRNSEMLHI